MTLSFQEPFRSHSRGAEEGPWMLVQLIPHLWVSNFDSFKATRPWSELGALTEPLPPLQSGDERWPLPTAFQL